MMARFGTTGIPARDAELPLPAAACSLTTARLARVVVGALLVGGFVATTGSLARATEPAPPADLTGPDLPAGPQLLPRDGLAPPASPAPIADTKTFEAVPPPTPDFTGAPPAGAIGPCADEYWIASS